MTDTRWQHPWLRIERLIRSIVETRWDTKTRPVAKAMFKRAIEERKKAIGMSKRRLRFAVVASTVLVAACATVPITGRTQLRFYSDAEIADASNREFARFSAFVDSRQLRLVSAESAQAAELTAIVKRVSDGILEAAGVAHRRWEVVIVKASEANAFATPGGKIVVFTGMFQVADSPAALAAVIGHEVGHLVAQHAAERLSQQVAVRTSVELLAALANPRYRPAVALVTSVGLQYGMLLPFSRYHELEADRLGQLFMAKAGYDPAEAVRVFERMSAREQSGPWEFVSSHPSDSTRTMSLREWLPEAMVFYANRDRPLPASAEELQELRKKRDVIAAAAPVAPRPSFLPTYWWRTKSSAQAQPLTFRFAGTERCAVGSCYRLESPEQGSTRLLTEDYAVAEDRLANGTVLTYSPPLTFVEWPLRVGATTEAIVTIKMSTGPSSEIRFKGQIVSYEPIKTAAGDFMGFKIVGSANGTPFRESWYVPEVRNEVRVITRAGLLQSVTLDLIDYEQSDDPVVDVRPR